MGGATAMPRDDRTTLTTRVSGIGRWRDRRPPRSRVSATTIRAASPTAPFARGLDRLLGRHAVATTRTTVTLDRETERLLKDAMRRHGQTSKQALNQAVVRGLAGMEADADEAPFEVQAAPTYVSREAP